MEMEKTHVKERRKLYRQDSSTIVNDYL